MFDKPEDVLVVMRKAQASLKQLREEREFEKRVGQIRSLIQTAAIKGRPYVNVRSHWVTDKIANILIEEGYIVKIREKCDRGLTENWMMQYNRISW